MSAPSSRRIGKYHVIASLGVGGQARVYLALMSGPAAFNKLLVLKVLRDDLDDPAFVDAFLQEARLAAQLNHPCVVQTYEIGAEDGNYFIAMEYVHGKTLSAVERRLKPQRLPLDIYLSILTDVARGLHHAHTLTALDGTSLNIVHRDVSPQNVMIGFDGQVKLLDFGIAKASGGELTRNGMIKGKLAYMAPEQLRGGAIDHRADQFALGVMLWQHVTGERFTGPSDRPELEILQDRLAGKEPRLRDKAPDVPAELIAICDRALALNPEDRFESADDFATALAELRAELSAPTSPRRLAQIMGPLFQADREELDAIVQQQVTALEREEWSHKVPQLGSTSGESSMETSRPTASGNFELRSGVLTKSEPPNIEIITEEPPSARRGWLVPSVAVVAVLAAGAVGWKLWAAPPTSPTPTPPVAHRAEPTSPTSTAPVRTENEVATVRLRLSAEPPEARAELDGEPVTLPLDRRVEQDDESHVLNVSAPGYEPARLTLTFSDDIQRVVTLEPESTAAAPDRRRFPIRRVRTPGSSSEGSGEATAAQEAPTQPRSETSPGASPPAGPRVLSPRVDTDNPYE